MIVITALAMMFSHAVFGQEKFTIAGGAGIKQKSVYSDMLGTIATACTTDEMPVEEVVTSGGAENLRLIKGNKVKAAIIPSDLLEAARFENASSVANIQTLFTLHMEAEHLIVRADTKKEGGISIGALKNIGGDSVNFNNPEDLKERQVGAVGGSAITARVISDMLRYKWQVTDVPSTNELIEKLAKGELDAILISAGLQSEAVKAIKGNFKLLPLRGNSDTARIYKAVKVEYPNLNNGRSVDTLGARAIMVTRT